MPSSRVLLTADGIGPAIDAGFSGSIEAVRTGSSDGLGLAAAAGLLAEADLAAAGGFNSVAGTGFVSVFSALGIAATGAVTCGRGEGTATLAFSPSLRWCAMYAQRPPPASTTTSATPAAIHFVLPPVAGVGCREGSGPLPSASVIEKVRTGCEMFLKFISPSD